MDSLTDDILIHILSFLPTKQAALTSVLSKRWRTLFTFTHNLEFDEPLISAYNNNGDNWRESRKIFRNFVRRIFALQADNHVEKFSLTLKHGRDRSMNHWIRYALKHGLSELHLCISREMRCPSRIFTSTTLVKLSLGSSLYIEFPSDTSLPSLKVLLLDEVSFITGQLSDVLLPACPVLEDLTLYYGDYPGFLYQTDPEYSHAITSKTIKNLYYSGRPLFTYYQFDLLVNATLDLGFYKLSVEQNVVELISGIRNVKTLHLTVLTVEVISECCKDELPVFNNLVELVFSSNRQGWKVLFPRLLECSPNLKVLVLSGLYRYRFKLNRFVGIQVPFENQIEMLRIKQCRGSANELKHIRHLLLNMKHLKLMKVYVAFRMDEPKRMQVTKDLMKIQTASSEVKIQVM